jgi:hypothetical protein
VRAQSAYVFPKTPFDYAATLAQLDSGNGTIKGVAIGKENDTKKIQIANLSRGHRARYGTQVTLFPLTPYFEEYLKLRKKKGNQAAISNEAFSCRVITWTDEKGEFEFRNLKPGKYYMEAVVQFVQKTERQVQTGTSNLIGGGGQVISSAPTYTTVFGSYNAAKLSTGITEIKADGTAASVTLKN